MKASRANNNNRPSVPKLKLVKEFDDFLHVMPALRLEMVAACAFGKIFGAPVVLTL